LVQLISGLWYEKSWKRKSYKKRGKIITPRKEEWKNLIKLKKNWKKKG